MFTINQQNLHTSIVIKLQYFSCFYKANAHLILANQIFVFKNNSVNYHKLAVSKIAV